MGLNQINTVEALRRIDINASDINDFAGWPITRARLVKWGIDPSCYHPKTAEFISDEQWIRLLIYYARKLKYGKAKTILNEYREEAMEDLRKAIN
jgi:hypothetical protein